MVAVVIGISRVTYVAREDAGVQTDVPLIGIGRAGTGITPEQAHTIFQLKGYGAIVIRSWRVGAIGDANLVAGNCRGQRLLQVQVCRAPRAAIMRRAAGIDVHIDRAEQPSRLYGFQDDPWPMT